VGISEPWTRATLSSSSLVLVALVALLVLLDVPDVHTAFLQMVNWILASSASALMRFPAIFVNE
jgi:hypothetical protein